MKLFSLEIEMCNDAMMTAADIALTLRNVIAQLEERDEAYTIIRDVNGNHVGSYMFSEMD